MSEVVKVKGLYYHKECVVMEEGAEAPIPVNVATIDEDEACNECNDLLLDRDDSEDEREDDDDDEDDDK